MFVKMLYILFVKMLFMLLKMLTKMFYILCVNFFYCYRKYGANPDYIDTQATERKHKESVKAIYSHTSKRKGIFDEEVAIGYAKKVKFQLLFEAFSRLKEPDEDTKKERRSKGSVIYIHTQPNGDLHYIPKRGLIHPLIHWRIFDSMLRTFLVRLQWSPDVTLVKSIQHSKLRDSTLISYGNKNGMSCGVLLADEAIHNTCFVRFVFSILKMSLKMLLNNSV